MTYLEISDELKKCPFCNQDADYNYVEYRNSSAKYWVRCLSCDARTKQYDTLNAAMDHWNIRT